MKVFIGGLNSKTTVADLVELIGRVIGHHRLRLVKHNTASRNSRYNIELLQGVARMVHIQMASFVTASGNEQCYLIANFNSKRLTDKVIARLNGQHLHGTSLVVRPFIERCRSQDRRQPSNCCWIGPERRQSDRRRTEPTKRLAQRHERVHSMVRQLRG